MDIFILLCIISYVRAGRYTDVQALVVVLVLMLYRQRHLQARSKRLNRLFALLRGQLCVIPLVLFLIGLQAVPDGKICCWFIESDPSVSFLFIKNRFIFYGTPGSTTAVVSRLRPRFAYILGIYGLARSQGGRQPERPLYIPVSYTHLRAPRDRG